MRQVVLDTETTGLDWERGHRVIEIGCVEIINRRLTGETYHCYLNPQRDIDPGAQEVHGLSAEDLADKPLFTDIADEFLSFVQGAELVIHNAPFDVGFLDNEIRLAGSKVKPLADSGLILDTLVRARKMHPGQRNSLDALCKRYGVDNSRRDLHGALLDARLLADVYLMMTGGQGALSLGSSESEAESGAVEPIRRVDSSELDLVVVQATAVEQQQHDAQLDLIDAACAQKSLWRRADTQ